MSRWYGNGGSSWINIGLPCYILVDRKPDKGCKIQNTVLVAGVEFYIYAPAEAGEKCWGRGTDQI